MDKSDVKRAKAAILRCLTEDFDYGRSKRTGLPLKRPKKNQAIFDSEDGFAVWSETNLEMVMDKVVLGLYFAMDESSGEEGEALE